MDHLRILLVPFHVTSLFLVVLFALLLAVLSLGGVYGYIFCVLLQVWVFKYCYVLVEQLADGATEPPVMASDMLSPLEIRPWAQLGIVMAGIAACVQLGGHAGTTLGIVLLALLPASIAVLGVGEPFFQAINPLVLWRLVRGLGPYYLLILACIPLYYGLLTLLLKLDVWRVAWIAALLMCELSFFGLIGGSLYLRRHEVGIEPSRSPERTAARAEAERVKLRARMLDDVFQQARIGKHVEATRPLAAWMGSLDGETAAQDAQHVATQALGWHIDAGLNTIGSTLIRHLLRAGRPDAALAVFLRLRDRSPALTLDSVEDLRSLVDYAESAGHAELAASMRLETPVFQPRM